MRGECWKDAFNKSLSVVLVRDPTIEAAQGKRKGGGEQPLEVKLKLKLKFQIFQMFRSASARGNVCSPMKGRPVKPSRRAKKQWQHWHRILAKANVSELFTSHTPKKKIPLLFYGWRKQWVPEQQKTESARRKLLALKMSLLMLYLTHTSRLTLPVFASRTDLLQHWQHISGPASRPYESDDSEEKALVIDTSADDSEARDSRKKGKRLEKKTRRL